MTEAEWAASGNEHAMLRQLRQLHRKQLDGVRTSQEPHHRARFDRRHYLFMVACCRRVQHLIKHDWHRFALDMAEEYEMEWEDHYRRDLSAMRKGREAELHDENPLLDLAVLSATLPHELWEATEHLLSRVAELLGENKQIQARKDNPLAGVPNAVLLRDIFGNPFRPVAADPSWRTSTVVALAEGIYADRAFDRLPILADALQDAGCDHADILAHCRGDGPHVRGCWVVDLLLGKE